MEEVQYNPDVHSANWEASFVNLLPQNVGDWILVKLINKVCKNVIGKIA